MQRKATKTAKTVDLALLANCVMFLVMVSAYLKYWRLWTTALIRPLQTILSIATLSKKRKETIETQKKKNTRTSWTLSQSVCITDMYSWAGQWNALTSETVFCQLTIFSIETLGYHAFHQSAEGTIQKCWGQTQWQIYWGQLLVWALKPALPAALQWKLLVYAFPVISWTKSDHLGDWNLKATIKL